MAWLSNENGSLFTRLQRLLNLKNQFGSSTPFLPVLVVNAPDAYAEKQVFASIDAGGSQAGTLGIVGNPGKDLYLTHLEISQESAVTTSGGVISITVLVNGSEKRLAHLSYPATTVTNNRLSLDFSIPIKVDVAANNIIVTDSGSDNTTFVSAVGYQM